MIKVIAAFVYLLMVIVASCMIPVIMIPIFQSYGLDARDVVGFTIFLVGLADVIILAFGLFIWEELS